MEADRAPRIVFMGTASFAVPSLELLVKHHLEPVAVVTGPDRPKGRGQKVRMTPVKEAALRLGIGLILQPEDVRSPGFAREIESLDADIIVVVAFRILPPDVYSQARKGAFNLHGSLLPQYRGAAPIQRAVMAGERTTGVTTFFLERKVDTGQMILQREMEIGENETAGDVHDRMMELGAEVVLETVRQILEGRVALQQQDDSLATKAPKIFKEDCEIDWSRTAREVHNHIRGLSPNPGAWTTHDGGQLKMYRSRLADGAGDPGEVLKADHTLIVACGEGAVEITELQQESRRRMDAVEFLKGYAIVPSDRLGAS